MEEALLRTQKMSWELFFPQLNESFNVGRIGIGIYHDIRFPELAMLYRAKGADLIIYPGAFNMSTRKMLWELETKARQVLS
ncbi:omega-amidase, chloroplastic-like [Chenopodium quinoa]|uniref:omega-amidase, chloroplastic-like n=1 Tax=Chenopodium quinoa TaxID=63459 RepID=UPI000B78D1F2|nr:omega-amidase, chloroplastic-like [Chenopodium quinoa]